MDDLVKLQYLSLVSKICTEFENHLGLTDKVLAEFVIELADKSPNLTSFNKALLENGAEFPESFVANLYNIIQKMRPNKAKQQTTAPATDEPNPLVKNFPGLAMPNGKPEWQEAEDIAKYVSPSPITCNHILKHTSIPTTRTYYAHLTELNA
jgi:ATP-dependent RNA helicase DHX8/PRP22